MLKKYRAYFLVLPVFFVALIVVFYTTKGSASSEVLVYDSNEISVAEDVKKEVFEELKTVKVDVKGEVINPGVYELLEGKRVNDAIVLSGGLTENADTRLINLSKTLKDEMVIIVYNKFDLEKLKQDNVQVKTVVEYIEKECVCPDQINDACIVKSDSSSDKKSTISDDSVSSKVNINTASKEELLTIKGIGETKADAIIKYRTEKGLFKDISEIKNISGIGDSTFEKIKDFITI